MRLGGLLSRGRGEQVPDALAVPFAWGYDDGSGAVARSPEALNGRRVTQCALSRICGVCAEPLGRPVAFVGTPEEVGRNAFHAPPLHLSCAEGLRRSVGWELVSTAGFEFVRPGREELETRPVFVPNSLVG